MPPRKTEAGAVGLRLTMPGAPCTPHNLPGLPGFYWPDRPTPVGQPGDPVTLEQAEQWAADPALPLELIPMDDPAAARTEYGTWLDASRGVLRQVAAIAEGDEAVIAADQLATANTAPVPDTTPED